MSRHLDDQQLQIQPADPPSVRAAKVAIKAGRRLNRDDDPSLVKIISSESVADEPQGSHGLIRVQHETRKQ